MTDNATHEGGEVERQEALEPCPMCGRQPIHNGSDGRGAHGFLCAYPDHRIQSYGATRADAVEAWNRRTLPPQVGEKPVGVEDERVPLFFYDSIGLERRANGLADLIEKYPDQHCFAIVGAKQLATDLRVLATLSPPPRDAERIVDGVSMGSMSEAQTEFMKRLDAWLTERQPSMDTAAGHKKRDAREQEALFRLGNAAAMLGWHIREGAVADVPPPRDAMREALEPWQPIDTAPKDGSNILIIAAGAYSPKARQGWWDGEWWAFYSRPEKFVVPGVTRMVEASHWMPLPALSTNTSETATLKPNEQGKIGSREALQEALVQPVAEAIDACGSDGLAGWDWWQNEARAAINVVLATLSEPLPVDAAERIRVLTEELNWIAMFADILSQDDSKVFARVNRGALRTIRDRARALTTEAPSPKQKPSA